jgi:hypothetical protein
MVDKTVPIELQIEHYELKTGVKSGRLVAPVVLF